MGFFMFKNTQIVKDISSSNIVDKCRTISLMAHAGDKNKHDGELYLLHVNRVSIFARELAPSYQINGVQLDPCIVEAIAWLHDVVEDTVVTLSDLNVLYSTEHSQQMVHTIISSVDALTKRKSEPNIEYYERVKLCGPYAVCVKMADMKDNFRRNHLIADPETQSRMAKKYSLGMSILS